MRSLFGSDADVPLVLQVLAGPFVLNLDSKNNTGFSGASSGGKGTSVGSNAAAATTGAATKLGFAASGLLGVAAFAALLL